MDTYPALPAFFGSLTAMFLVEVLRRVCPWRLLSPTTARTMPTADVLHGAENNDARSGSSGVSVRSGTHSAILRGIAGPPSGMCRAIPSSSAYLCVAQLFHHSAAR